MDGWRSRAGTAGREKVVWSRCVPKKVKEPETELPENDDIKRDYPSIRKQLRTGQGGERPETNLQYGRFVIRDSEDKFISQEEKGRQ